MSSFVLICVLNLASDYLLRFQIPTPHVLYRIFNPKGRGGVLSMIHDTDGIYMWRVFNIVVRKKIKGQKLSIVIHSSTQHASDAALF